MQIVILSLVRNSGGAEEDEQVYGHSSAKRANIGFLKVTHTISIVICAMFTGLYHLVAESYQRYASRGSFCVSRLTEPSLQWLCLVHARGCTSWGMLPT